MKSAREAWSTIVGELGRERPSQRLAVAGSLGRVLASGVTATVDQPPADVSAMDGFAIGELGDASTPQRLPIVGTAAAGAPLELTVAPGTAVRIMTGAVVPAGTDRVVPVEDVDPSTSDSELVLGRVPSAGEHVRWRGEVVAVGDHLLERGQVVDPATVGLLASHGVAEVEVVAAPDVAVLATGDELVPATEAPGAGQLRNSNSAYLLAALGRMGLAGESLGIAPDRPEELARRLARGVEHEVLIVSGGVSMGAFDFVDRELRSLGCRVIVDGVAIQPGKPLVVARSPRGWVFGLPGNPASVLVTFQLFVRPLLRRLLGHDDGFWHAALIGELVGPLPGAGRRERFLPARVVVAGGRLLVDPRSPQGSHDQVVWAGAAALVRVRCESSPRSAGEPCELVMLDGRGPSELPRLDSDSSR